MLVINYAHIRLYAQQSGGSCCTESGRNQTNFLLHASHAESWNLPLLNSGSATVITKNILTSRNRKQVFFITKF